ncbi:MAG TPA: hypothetical protein VL127_00355 [Bryobacteraceae bacterium]|nr:hypothetical protein [Bryobacteraceae bacterium]
MIELITTVIITASSVLLFGYWFRYTCLLILSAKTARDFAGQVAAANQLGFLEVQAQLRAASANLDSLRDTLDRDYAVLSSMLKQVRGSSVEESSLETTMLSLNYRVMRAWYRVSGVFSPAAARKALEEMSMVIAHFANAMGQQAEGAAA